MTEALACLDASQPLHPAPDCAAQRAGGGRMKLRGTVLVAAVLWTGVAAAAGLPLDAGRACQRLVAAAQTWQLAGAGRCGQYVCEHQHQASARHVFALRWRGDGLPAAGGSNLVGYYLVDAASGAIHAWDLGEDRRGEVLPRFHAKTASSTCPSSAGSYQDRSSQWTGPP